MPAGRERRPGVTGGVNPVGRKGRMAQVGTFVAETRTLVLAKSFSAAGRRAVL